MIGSRSWRALMRRNLIYRKRNWIGTILELILPICFVAILVAIKNAVSDTDGFAPEIEPADFPDENDILQAFSFTDYVTAMQAKRVCQEIDPVELSRYRYEPVNGAYYGISGIAEQGYNWQVPFVRCDSRKCEEDGEDAAPYCEYMALGLAPSTDSDSDGQDQVDRFERYIYDRYPVLRDLSTEWGFDFVQKFDSDKDMEKYTTSGSYLKRENGPKLALGIVLDGTDSEFNYNYRLRLNATNFNSPEDEGRPATVTTPPTNRKTDTFAKKDEVCITEGGTPEFGDFHYSCTGQYMYNGAITMQRLLGDWIHTETGAKDAGYFVSEHGVSFAPFPTREYTTNGFYEAIGGFLASLFITIGLLWPVASMVRYVVLEKELRQKELMKMMSVTEADIGWSWFVTFFGFHFITATLTALVTTKFYVNSDGFYLWIFWVFTFLSITTFCMFLAAFFVRATRATLVSILVFFVGFIMTLFFDYKERSAGTIFLISLHPVGVFSFGLQEIGRLEDLSVGLKSSTISETDSPSGYTFSNTIGSFIFDSILFGFLTFYVNRVIKSEYGRNLPLYFPLQPSYWFPGRFGGSAADEGMSQDAAYNEGLAVEEPSNALKEQVAQGKGIQIRNLMKQFGDKTAVDGLSLDIFSGQITALLGHNGAGKTTTISMLTGMLEATAGSAKINGKSIQTNMNDIRQECGICLQHDCLFGKLTVKEHLQFFARIKGLYARVSWEEAEAMIETSIKDVALAEKSNTFSQNLSGGMKRKLSVAIAFCGGSKTVLLDEPTSGMDPFSRRFTWNVIRQYRQDRTIILTTHFMDEADILGDRIAIMAEGQLRCVGSSLFLKKTYGVGYQLTIEKKSSDHADFDDKLDSLVKESVPEANMLSNVGTELTYQLPLSASASFVPMLNGLDKEVDQKNVVTYGVGITTLDEVFLLVARGDSADKEKLQSSMRPAGDVVDNEASKSLRSRMDLETEKLFARHLGALFRKRAANFKRDKKAWCCTTILPTLFVLVGFILFKFVAPSRDLDPYTLTMDDFNVKIDGTEAQPRNVIPFNSPNADYTCQTMRCIYDDRYTSIDDPVTGETYDFCGVKAMLPEKDAACSIEQSSMVMDRIDSSVGTPVEQLTVDVTNTSYALSESANTFDASQYGAVYFTHEERSLIQSSGQNYSEAVIEQCLNTTSDYFNASECLNYAGFGYNIRYNTSGLHVAPLFQALADEALVREALNDDGFKIQVTVAPLPLTEPEANYGNSEDAFTAWFLIVLAWPFICGSFATFVVQERESKAKHLQTVAGVKPYSYWFSTWLWDSVNYQIPCWTTIALMYIFNIDVLTTTERDVAYGIILLIWLFGPAAASFTYCLSFMFKSPSVANMVIIISGFLLGLGGTLATFILRLIGFNPGDPKQNLLDAATITTWILRMHPSFSLSSGIYYAINIETVESYFNAGEPTDVWSKDVLGIELIYLAVQSFAYLFLAMKIDEWSANPRAVSIWRKFLYIATFQFCCPSGGYVENPNVETPDDDDVLAEQARVTEGGAEDDLIVVKNLVKQYDNGKVAVNNISFGIPPGQCFGLLGINGAGKTTTMGMLTAEFPPSSGDATLAGFSVTNEPEKTRRRVGYCPQFDAHFTNLTGREHVELYASIKGIPKDMIVEAASQKLKEVGLSDEDSDRLCMGYSGGMKRRLSLACATIGQPQIVFLDECSTGVDPVARREIWQMISDMVTGGNLPKEERTSVILTTHSMEECEALCPQIAIMAGGKIRCLGSAQHLKSKFGQGYQVEMKIKNVDPKDSDYLENVQKLAQACEINLPSSSPAASLPEEEAAKVEEGAVAPMPSSFDEIFINFDQTWMALQVISGDDYLINMVNEQHPVGYLVYKEAKSAMGIDLDALAVFCTSELRMRRLNQFIETTYAASVLRERQDTKARYEVGSHGVRISEIFQAIEENKAALNVDEYGVSQTSLEQVFNIHAAEAERLKYGTNDG